VDTSYSGIVLGFFDVRRLWADREALEFGQSWARCQHCEQFANVPSLLRKVIVDRARLQPEFAKLKTRRDCIFGN